MYIFSALDSGESGGLREVGGYRWFLAGKGGEVCAGGLAWVLCEGKRVVKGPYVVRLVRSRCRGTSSPVFQTGSRLTARVARPSPEAHLFGCFYLSIKAGVSRQPPAERICVISAENLCEICVRALRASRHAAPNRTASSRRYVAKKGTETPELRRIASTPNLAAQR